MLASFMGHLFVAKGPATCTPGWGLDRKLLELSTSSCRRAADDAAEMWHHCDRGCFGTEGSRRRCHRETRPSFSNYMCLCLGYTVTVMLVARSPEGDLEQIARLRKQSYWLSFVPCYPLPNLFLVALSNSISTHKVQSSRSLSVVLFFVGNAVYSRNGHLYSCLARLGKWSFHFMRRRLAWSFELVRLSA